MTNFTHKCLQVFDNDIVYNDEYYRSNKVECDEYAEEMNYRDDVLALVVPIDFKLSEEGCSLAQARAELAAFEAGAYQPQKQQQQQLQAPAAKQQKYHVVQQVAGSYLSLTDRTFAIRFTAKSEEACERWMQENGCYTTPSVRVYSDSMIARSKQDNDEFLPTVYDKSAIMKRAAQLRKRGKTASQALKMAWAEAKKGK